MHELEVGSLFVVVGAKRQEPMGDGLFARGSVTVPDGQYEGRVFRVLAMCGCNVAAEVVFPRYFTATPVRMSIDRRGKAIEAVEESYLDALLPAEQPAGV